MNADYKLIRKKAKKNLRIIFFILGGLVFIMLIICLILAFYRPFRTIVCSCDGNYEALSRIINFGIRILIFAI